MPVAEPVAEPLGVVLQGDAPGWFQMRVLSLERIEFGSTCKSTSRRTDGTPFTHSVTSPLLSRTRRSTTTSHSCSTHSGSQPTAVRDATHTRARAWVLPTACAVLNYIAYSPRLPAVMLPWCSAQTGSGFAHVWAVCLMRSATITPVHVKSTSRTIPRSIVSLLCACLSCNRP